MLRGLRWTAIDTSKQEMRLLTSIAIGRSQDCWSCGSAAVMAHAPDPSSTAARQRPPSRSRTTVLEYTNRTHAAVFLKNTVRRFDSHK